MKVDIIKSELFKLLSAEKSSYYVAKSSDERSKCSERYKIFNEYYLLINNNSTFSYVFNLKNKVKEESVRLENKYNELIINYESILSEEEREKVVPLINIYVYKIDALNTVYNILNKELKSESKNNFDYSNNVIKLLFRLDKEEDSEKRESIESEIYRLNDERRAIMTSTYGDSALKYLSVLESLEMRIARSRDDKMEPYELDKKSFIISLKETIKAINDYYFKDFKKSKYYKERDADYNHRLGLYIRKYRSLISSLFQNNFCYIENKTGKISSDDLLNYLSIYNLDGDYDIFNAKNKNSLLGNEVVTRMEYKNYVDVLNGYVSKLLDDCISKFKGETITIEDKNENVKDLLDERKELFNLLLNQEKKGEDYARK